MSKNELEKLWDYSIDLPYREKVEELQRVLIDHCKNNNMDLDVAEEGRKVVYPTETKYNHYFSNGLYIREMFCKKDYLGFTIIHNTANPLFLMKGKVAFASEDGVEELTAPMFILTKPGTKRICYWIEDCVIINVHANPDGLTDLKEMEEKLYSNTWDQYDKVSSQDTWEIMEHTEYRKKIKNEKNK